MKKIFYVLSTIINFICTVITMLYGLIAENLSYIHIVLFFFFGGTFIISGLLWDKENNLK